MPTILHTESSDGWGGQEIRVFTEALHLRARGHRVLLACPPQSQLFARSREVGLGAIPVPFKRALDPSDFWRIWWILSREKVEILNTHSSRDSWTASLAGRLVGIPIIRTRHLSLPVGRHPFATLVYSRLCDRIVTAGEAIRELLIREARVGPSRVVSIPTGVDFGWFDPFRVDGEYVRKELGVAKDVPLIGMVAVLRSWKGHRLFLQAFQIVLEQLPSCVALIAGEGPYRDVINDLIGDLRLVGKVKILGHREDIPELLDSLDVVVSASTAAEGVPQALMQALAMRRPVVATNVGGVSEVVRDKETGLLVQPGDPRVLAEAIMILLRDGEEAARLAANGRRLVEQEFGLPLMLERLESLYQEVLAGR